MLTLVRKPAEGTRAGLLKPLEQALCVEHPRTLRAHEGAALL